MIKEQDFQWYFEKEGKVVSQGVNNPFVEYFSNAPFAALVRESLQNSLDAAPKDSDKPVIVEYNLKSVNAEDFPRFLSTLRRHVEACLESDDEDQTGEKFKPMLDFIDSKPKEIIYLEVSDKNTLGMYYTPNEKKKGTFYSFLRSVGRTDKQGASGGSFGFGKGAYYNVSILQSLIVSSLTPDGDALFEGAAALCSHEILEEGKLVSYTHTGFYDSAASGGDPITESVNIEGPQYTRIPSEFQRKEPGTSINIMGFSNEGLTPGEITKRMAEAVLRHFFRAIQEEKLEVEINIDPTKKVSINKAELSSLLEEYFESDKDSVQRSIIDRYNPKPYAKILRSAVPIDFDPEKKAELQKECSSLSNVVFYASLERLKGVKLYLGRDDGAHGTILHMRKQNMLIFADKYDKKEGFLGVFVCDNEEGNSLLKMMEDPTHRKWDSSRRRNSAKFSSAEAKKVLDELRLFIVSCIEIMFPVDESNAEDVDYLGDDWYLPTVVDETSPNYAMGVLTDVTNGESGEGGPVGAIIEKDGYDRRIGDSPLGKVFPIIEGLFKDDPTGGFLGGKGSSKKKKGKGDYHGPAGKKSYSKGKGSKSKSLLGEAVPADYNVFAYKNKKGEYVYDLHVFPEKEVKPGVIRVSVSGESEIDDNVKIKWSSSGRTDGASIYLDLVEGENQLQFSFQDNERYAITLDVFREPQTELKA